MKNKKVTKSKSDIERVVQAFLKGETKKRCGNYFIEDNKLVYKTVAMQLYKKPYHNEEGATASERLKHRSDLKRIKDAAAKGIIRIFNANGWSENIRYEALAIETVALRLQTGDVLGNSSVLKYIGRSSVFGKTKLNRSETAIQSLLSKHVPMIPFSVFTEAKLDMDTFNVIDRGVEETIEVKHAKKVKGKSVVYFEKQHFTGASLFNVGGKTYLFDMDRRELEHGIVNPFVVEIPNGEKCLTIKDAYNILIPIEVKEAIKQKQNVKRQGEWFFIPVSPNNAALLERYKKEVKEIKLQAGPNRPNRVKGVQLYKGRPVKDQRGLLDFEQVEQARSIVKESEFYVTGRVTHDGREHADLLLKGWFRAVPNTATNSFTIQGDID